MSRYIDADAAIEAIKRPRGGCYTEEAKAFAVYQVLSVPTADVVEVVRCRECKYNLTPSGEGAICDYDGYVRKQDWFCADGERRTE